MSHNPDWYRRYYVENKVRIQEKNDAWLASHPGWKQQYNRKYYQRRVAHLQSAKEGK